MPLHFGPTLVARGEKRRKTPLTQGNKAKFHPPPRLRRDALLFFFPSIEYLVKKYRCRLIRGMDLSARTSSFSRSSDTSKAARSHSNPKVPVWHFLSWNWDVRLLVALKDEVLREEGEITLLPQPPHKNCGTHFLWGIRYNIDLIHAGENNVRHYRVHRP